MINYLSKLLRPHCDVTGMMVSKGNYPKIALCQVRLVMVSELLWFTQMIWSFSQVYQDSNVKIYRSWN